MQGLPEIRRQLASGSYELSRHAMKRAVERDISEAEIREAGRVVEIIEDYPDDKYSPSCLLLGFAANGRPLHLQVSYAQTEKVKIVTIYEPDPGEWTGFRERKKP